MPKNVNRVRNAMLHSPRQLARQHSLAFGINVRSFCRMLHCDLHYHPFKIQIVQALSEQDKACHVQFCSKFFDFVQENPCECTTDVR